MKSYLFFLPSHFSYDGYNVPSGAGSAEKQCLLNKLVAALNAGMVQVTTKIYVKLPLSNAHTNHVITKDGASRMHKQLREKIREQVSMGITSVPYLKRVLKSFVEKEMIMNYGDCVSPSTHDRRYFPTNKDIRNCIHSALVKGRYSGLDQENVYQKLEDWKEERPDDKFFYRKCSGEEVSRKTKKKLDTVFESEEEEEVVYDEKDDDDDDNDDDEGKDASDIQKNALLWIHQSKDQQKILQKYGDLVLIDAARKTTKYALPIFLLVVRTNVAYIPVAEFVAEAENIENIAKALEIIKSWNDRWEPKYFVLDYSEQTYQALQQVFPSSLLVSQSAMDVQCSTLPSCF